MQFRICSFRDTQQGENCLSPPLIINSTFIYFLKRKRKEMQQHDVMCISHFNLYVMYKKLITHTYLVSLYAAKEPSLQT
ncbi:uncharacterized protein SPAR_B00380 [Saccharomyces paradoxus]|uniref:Uncharacterized protein n=1 Tax=Saccharomyces paradoxus TaxID=27291 RepID=A0A8B8ULL3_SACPA|nr:uncharacterized protein SPAR_B00380 [Saccharomyces paradoxus]QHS71499.1 hypothetical protein SPAR_B00380 [Saccharomyces paradoxus]